METSKETGIAPVDNNSSGVHCPAANTTQHLTDASPTDSNHLYAEIMPRQNSSANPPGTNQYPTTQYEEQANYSERSHSQYKDSENYSTEGGYSYSTGKDPSDDAQSSNTNYQHPQFSYPAREHTSNPEEPNADYQQPHSSHSTESGAGDPHSHSKSTHTTSHSSYLEGQNWDNYGQDHYSNQQDGWDGYSDQYSYPNESGYDSTYNQGSTRYNENYNTQYSDSYNQSEWNREHYRSNWSGYSDSSHNQQQQQEDFPGGNYPYQNTHYHGFPSYPRGYTNHKNEREGYTNDRDRGYYRDQSYGYREGASTQNYSSDSSYKYDDHYNPHYDSGYNQGRSYHSRNDSQRFGDPRRPTDREDNARRDSKSFVQRRSALLKRAQGNKLSKASRGPQIVQPHRMTESDTKKAEKSKQSESVYPKRNLDSFKIPKKKSAVPVPSPVKKTPSSSATTPTNSAHSPIPIPALDIKEPEQLHTNKHVSAVKAQETVVSTLSSSEMATPVPPAITTCASVVTSTPSSSNSKKPAISFIEKAISAKSEQPVTKVKKKQTSNTKAKSQAIAKKNTIPSVLSTLDSKTLLSLAVTLQKSIEQVKAEKNASHHGLITVPTSTSAPATVSNHPCTSLPGTSTSASTSNGSTVQTVTSGMQSLAASLPSTSIPMVNTISSILSAIKSKHDPKDTLTTSSALSTLLTRPVVSSITSTTNKPISDKPTMPPPLDSHAVKESSTGLVLATVLSSSHTPATGKPDVPPTSVSKLDPATIQLQSTPAIPVNSLPLLVKSVCTTSVSSSVASDATLKEKSDSHKHFDGVIHQPIATLPGPIGLPETVEESHKRARPAEEIIEENYLSSVKRPKPDAKLEHCTLPLVNTEHNSEQVKQDEQIPTKAKQSVGREKSRKRSISRSKKKDSELNLGFLFGPYKLSLVQDTAEESQDDSAKGSNDAWLHEECAVWTPGVCLVGGQLMGYQEAISEAEKMICVQCKMTGATLCCSTHRCKKCYHYHCASEANCYFDREKFLITCPKHLKQD